MAAPALPVHEAAGRGDVAALARLIAEDPVSLHACDDFGRTPLFWAARHGRTDAVAWLLAQGAMSADGAGDGPDALGNRALHLACREGHLPVVRLLLGCGMVDPACRNNYGWTALIAAAVHGHEAVVAALLAHGGSEVDARWGSWGLTALHQACFYRHAGVVRLLLQHGANPCMVDGRGRRPIDMARETAGAAEPSDAMGTIEAMLLEAMLEPERARALARARLLADADAAATATTTAAAGAGGGGGVTNPSPLLAARLAKVAAADGSSGPLVTVMAAREGKEEEQELEASEAVARAADVAREIVARGALPPGLLLELLDMLAPPWDPVRG